MSRSNSSIVSKVKSIWKTFFSNKETARELVERNDLYKIALASTYRQLRLASKPLSSSASASASTHNKTELEIMFDKATDSLEKETQAHELGLRSLRFHVQSLVQPQAIDLLQTCKDVDEQLKLPQDDDGNVDENREEVIGICKGHLLQERNDIRDVLEQTTTERQRAYLEQRLNALQILSTFYEWENASTTSDAPSKDGDAFGYHINQNNEINKSIRCYQMINLTKALLIKKHLGYATLALKSSIPKAGRGVFVDGFAPAGSLVAFVPGKVWPKEYLLNVKASSPVFKEDPKQQLSIRYDDILIDSRKAPYTVLDNENSNAFGIGHIVNHPSKSNVPNCGTVMIDLMENMNLQQKGLDAYVPNTYVKQPMMFGPQAMDREKVAMHGFGLIASRDLENEELFYDYRLSPGEEVSYPSWYHVCDEEELKNRWTQS